MKTAEEWIDTHVKTVYGEQTIHNMLTCSESDWTEEDLVNAFKQIQLDAMKEGMRRAANGLIRNCGLTQPLKQAILTAAEQLIELPK